MPVNFKIYADHSFVMASFHGHVSFDDFVSSAQTYAADPTYRNEQNILIDLSGYLGTERDIVGMMQVIADVFDHLKVGQSDRLFVCVAPTPLARELAQTIVNSVTAIPGYVTRITDTHLAAFEILGVSTKGHDCAWVRAKV